MKYALSSVAILGWSAINVNALVPVFGQCGGWEWLGETECVPEAYCLYVNQWYSQCLRGTASSSSTKTSISTSSSRTTTSITTTATVACASSTPPAGSGTLSNVGVNIAGFDFGCLVDGTCDPLGTYGALPAYGGPDGPGQMQHFYKDDRMNTFRLPVGWQYLVSSPGGTLIASNFSKYNELMSACLNVASDVTCIVDIHNYARWNGGIIGQGGPTNAEFSTFWGQIAAKYKDQPRVWFGIMNEPHDVPDINLWATSVQAAVTAIRNAGAKQPVLLPGNGWASAEAFISSGSADALSKVKNPDGSITNIYFDVHKYLDFDNSGTHSECVMNNIDNAFAPLAQWLRCHGRKAILTESGGGNTASCVKYMCEQIAYLKANSDVYLGYTGWSAGSFDSTYVLTETPTKSGNTWTDTLLVSSCLKR